MQTVATFSPAVGAASWAWLMVAIPLCSAAVLLVGGRATNKWGHWLGVVASWASFAVGVAVIVQLANLPAQARAIDLVLYQWANLGAGVDPIQVGMLLDPLSMTFVMLVTFVGSLIHVYAVAYMEHDEARRRFFAYLNIFIAAMLTLVLADSYVLLFFGWEGVGLASYLLIGFWNQVPEYATAAKKAFIMNRVGDMGLLLAMMAMFFFVGSFSYQKVLAEGALTGSAATIVGIFLLVGACGKSAQFPLQAWLGDAMAGPTPVSALIHAATMVTAGVYLMVRSGVVYVATPTAQLLVAIVGAITLMFGAIVGCAKDDMKKVLAASTMSQIGYMMLGAGLGPIGWAFAILHLVGHGFFKALMFLGAGSVMHGMNDQVNMRRFGALSKAMKVTWVTFMMGWLAILGVPPFTGFFTKDPIIESAFIAGSFGTTGAWIFGLVAMVGAGITAFYMSRLFFMTFHGKSRWTMEADGHAVHPHESGPLMTVPMIILAVFAVGFGIAVGPTGWFQTWLAPVTGMHEHGEPVLPELAITGITLALVILGAVMAWMQYGRREVPITAPSASALVVAARNDLYQDAVNENLFMHPGIALTKGVTVADKSGIDGIVEGLGKGSLGLGGVIRTIQNGQIRAYAGFIAGGALIALVSVLATLV
ncbi:MAG: NADH-quinone oxidoreductase subunit L [Actinomycetaceae bacterium]|nr:NADH-quinone oxidoreductase subunit L [Actinomycetaceae bacterium]